MNVLKPPLVPAEKILIPPLHVKLGLMKNFVKTLPTDSPAFKHLQETIYFVSFAKIKEGMYLYI